MYAGSYETSGFKSFVFGFFPAIRFFPHVYSRYAFFFCYHRSLHAISYQATMAKEQE